MSKPANSLQPRALETFAKGEWRWVKGKTLIHIETVPNGDAPSIPICSIPKSRIADANLIVAAPAMLAMLESLAGEWDADHAGHALIASVRR